MNIVKILLIAGIGFLSAGCAGVQLKGEHHSYPGEVTVTRPHRHSAPIVRGGYHIDSRFLWGMLSTNSNYLPRGVRGDCAQLRESNGWRTMLCFDRNDIQNHLPTAVVHGTFLYSHSDVEWSRRAHVYRWHDDRYTHRVYRSWPLQRGWYRFKDDGEIVNVN